MKLFLLHLAHRGWLLRAKSAEAAIDELLQYEPALGQEPDGLRPGATYPGLLDQRGTLAKKLIEVPEDGQPGRVYQWGY